MAINRGNWKRNMCQMGVGGAVAATTVWRGVFGGWDDSRVRENAEEQIGLDLPSDRDYDGWLGVTVPMPETVMTYEQPIHLFDAGILVATPVVNATEWDWLYEYPTDGSARSVNVRTLELGNSLISEDVYEIERAFPTEIKMTGAQKEAWMISGTWSGNRAIQSAFTEGITKPTVTNVLFSNTELYIDDSGGTIGTTQISGALLEADITINTGLEWVEIGDGVLYPSIVRYGTPTVDFTIKLELTQNTVGPDSTVANERAAFDANSVRLIRLDCPGPGGLNFTWDMAAKYTNVSAYETQGDFGTAVTFEGQARWSQADDFFFSALFTNGLSTMP